MKCEYCDNEIQTGCSRCPSCGASVTQCSTVKQRQDLQKSVSTVSSLAGNIVKTNPEPQVNPYLFCNQKSRVAYIVLAIFLGELGIHNFYAGYIGRGIAQLLITILSFGFLFWISWIWAFIELCAVTSDGRGVPFE